MDYKKIRSVLEEVIQCWNLDKMEDGRYRTQDWMIIQDGGSCEAAGYCVCCLRE